MITKHPTSRTLIVHSINNLDALRVEHYRQKLRTLIDEGYHNLIFDLAETPFVNSSGLGLLVEFFNTITRCNGTFKLINCNEQVLWLLHQAHLDSMLQGSISSSVSSQPTDAPGHDKAAGDARYDRLHELMSSEILLLTHINNVIGETIKLEDKTEIGEVILKGVLKAMRAQTGALLMLNADEDYLELTRWLSPQRRNRPAIDRFPFKRNRDEYRLLEEDEIAWRRLKDESPDSYGTFRQLGFENLLIASIRGLHRRFGFLAIEATPETERIVQTARPMIRTFTQVCGQAMEKAALLEELRDSNAELSDALERLRVSHQSLLNAGRLAALGTVISGLGHQLNNKLVPVIGYCQLLTQKRSLPTEAMNKLDMIQAASNEMQMIIEKLLRLSRIRERIATTLDAHECIQTALDLLSGQIENRRVHVDVHLAEESPVVHGDPDLFLQALLAILHRSCTSFDDVQTERWVRVITSVSDSKLRIVIEDNGSGLNDYDNEDWLDPLVPLTAICHGQIFNYNIPRGVIRRHKGALEVEERKDGGKRVTIDLPIQGNVMDAPTRPSLTI